LVSGRVQISYTGISGFGRELGRFLEEVGERDNTAWLDVFGGDETTLFTMSYDYEPKGALWSFLGPVLDRQFGKGFSGFIDLLEPVAQARAAA
jgi:hypothetical protein